jgi:hypothetical protein
MLRHMQLYSQLTSVPRIRVYVLEQITGLCVKKKKDSKTHSMAEPSFQCGSSEAAAVDATTILMSESRLDLGFCNTRKPSRSTIDYCFTNC